MEKDKIAEPRKMRSTKGKKEKQKLEYFLFFSFCRGKTQIKEEPKTKERK